MGGGPGRVLAGGALEQESWWRRVPVERAEEFGEAARVECWDVSAARVSEAVGRLESRAWCGLTREEAARFVGGEVGGAEGGEGARRVVLLRCLKREPESGGDDRGDTTRVAWSAGAVQVQSAGLRDNYTRVGRGAVVAVLPSEPREVFVDVLTAIR